MANAATVQPTPVIPPSVGLPSKFLAVSENEADSVVPPGSMNSIIIANIGPMTNMDPVSIFDPMEYSLLSLF